VLHRAFFLKRYKRFFADVQTESGELLTLHCANTGSMQNCLVEGSPCWYSLSDNPKRKLVGTLEIVTTAFGNLAGVNTARPNALVKGAIEADLIPELCGYSTIRSESCYVEVKNVTLDCGNGCAQFPDAVTARGAKHLRELSAMVAAGHRAVLLFCVQLSGVDRVSVASHIDRVYAETLAEAMASGVEVLAWQADFDGADIRLQRPLPFKL
jgi:sugar fermentation stimulation protein A